MKLDSITECMILVILDDTYIQEFQEKELLDYKQDLIMLATIHWSRSTLFIKLMGSGLTQCMHGHVYILTL